MSTSDHFSEAETVVLVSIIAARDGLVPWPYRLRKGALQGRLLTLRVVRSWKGSLHPDDIVYGWTQSPNIEDAYPRTDVGTHIIVFYEKGFPYEIRSCNAANPDRLNEVSQELDAIVRGNPSDVDPSQSLEWANRPGGDAKSACERAADNWFKKKYPVADEQTPLGSGKVTYTSHFSSTKSDCFVDAVEAVHLRNDGATDAVDSEIHHLIDLKTGEQIGQLVIFSNHLGLLWCEVGEAKCRSVEEWNTLADSYMKD